MNWLTKKNALIFNSFGCAFFLLLVYLGTDTCYGNEFCRPIRSALLHDYLIFTAVFPILFLFSLLTYFSPGSVFRAWRNFSVWAVPLVVLFTIFLANISTSGDISGAYGEALVYTALFATFGIYALASIVVIVLAWLKARKYPGEKLQ